MADRLSIVRRLAVGGTAEIVLARDGTGPVIVVKRLLPEASAAMQRRLDREAEILSAVASPHLVKLLGRSHRALHLEYVEGLDAGALILRLAKRGEALEPNAVAAVGLGLARALVALHEQGWVHADVAPGNVLIARDGTVKVCDLGVTRRLGDPGPPAPEGTLAYQPPEQLGLAGIDGAADVYAAALILYELSTGTLARPAGPLGLAELCAARREPPAPPSAVRMGLPPAFDELLMDALDPTPLRRPSAAEWCRRFEAWPSDAAPLASRVKRALAPIPPARTNAPAGGERSQASEEADETGSLTPVPALRRPVPAEATTPAGRAWARPAPDRNAGPVEERPYDQISVDTYAGRPSRPAYRSPIWVTAAMLVLIATTLTAYVQSRPRRAPVLERPRVEAVPAAAMARLPPSPLDAASAPPSSTPTASLGSASSSVSSPTSTEGQAPAPRPRPPKRPAPRPRRRVPLAKPPPAGPRLEIRAEGSIIVRGHGMDGPAPQTSEPLSEAASLFRLSAAGLSVRLRVHRAPDRATVLTVAAPPGTYHRVTCGAGPRRWTPLVGLRFRRSVGCEVEGTDGTAVRFTLVVRSD